MEDSARMMEAARDRWGALMRGLAGDLDLGQEDLVELVETAALELAVADAAAVLELALAAARAGKDPDLAIVDALTSAAARLREHG
jgi:hypothetical protein